jgi:hypothetical protein
MARVPRGAAEEQAWEQGSTALVGTMSSRRETEFVMTDPGGQDTMCRGSSPVVRMRKKRAPLRETAVAAPPQARR